MELRRTTAFAAIAAAAATIATPAWAQATRTWVSGTGDDVNPCSRTAPCKTFAGAISKTAAGGEINCLDPGGFGAVTITKSMTISCPYTEGGALAGGNGIVVNDSATATPGTAVVFLRGLDIFGVNPPSNGVRFISGAALHIHDSVIRRFNAANSQGVSFQPSGVAQLYIYNTTIANNGSGATGGGILVQPTGSGNAKIELRDVRVIDNANHGIRFDTTGTLGPTGSVMTVINSQVTGNTANGITVIQPGSVAVTMMVVNSTVSHNVAFGISATGAGSATVRVSNSVITGNVNAGIQTGGGGTVRSYGDNILDGNANPSSFTLPNLPKA
jgi:hypothetical protein